MTVIIIVVVVVIAFQILMRSAQKTGAATKPVGTVETYTYTGKSGGLSEQFSKMGMERHINMMITNGWDVVNQTGLPGHIRLGRTLTGAALTGGLTLLAGGSRTTDRVTITYRRVQIPRVVTSQAKSEDADDLLTRELVGALERTNETKSHVPPQSASLPIARYCCSCGSTLHEGSRFCSSCGAVVEAPNCAARELEPDVGNVRPTANTKLPANEEWPTMRGMESREQIVQPPKRSIPMAVWGVVGALVMGIIIFALAKEFEGSPPDNSSSIDKSPDGSISEVKVSCVPDRIQAGQTSNCSAALARDFSATFAWSVDDGAIDRNGNYTAPKSTASTTVTVTATNKTDSTKWGQAQIVVDGSLTGRNGRTNDGDKQRDAYAQSFMQELTEKGFDILVYARSHDGGGPILVMDSDMFKDTATRVQFINTVLPASRKNWCPIGFRKLRLKRGGTFDLGQDYPLHCSDTH
jgi:hypothetical protein